MRSNSLIVFLLLAIKAFTQSSSESEQTNYKINHEPIVYESESGCFELSTKLIYSLSPISRYVISNDTIYAESKTTKFSIKSNNSIYGFSKPKHFIIGSTENTAFIEKRPAHSLVINRAVKHDNTNTYALIIGNEDYKTYQTNLNYEQNVDFALKDAQLFRKVCNEILAIPNDNIIYLENAGFIKMQQAIKQIELICKHGGKDVSIILYYAGHGLPDEQTKTPHLIPVDVSGASLEYAISLPYLYEKLTKYPVKKTVVFLDACFSGGARNTGLVASRGVKIVPKHKKLSGNLIVFSATSENQSAKAHNKEKHGLFSYFLTKKLIKDKGKTTLGGLDEYLQEKIPIKSILINKVEQNPQTNVSENIKNKWSKWKLK